MKIVCTTVIMINKRRNGKGKEGKFCVITLLFILKKIYEG